MVKDSKSSGMMYSYPVGKTINEGKVKQGNVSLQSFDKITEGRGHGMKSFDKNTGGIMKTAKSFDKYSEGQNVSIKQPLK